MTSATVCRSARLRAAISQWYAVAAFRVAPGSLRATDILLAAGIPVQSNPIADLATGGKATLALVGDETLDRGVVHDRVADFGAVDVPVEMKEEANLPLRPLIQDAHPSHQHVATKVDRVVEGQADQEVGMSQRDVGDQRVRH